MSDMVKIAIAVALGILDVWLFLTERQSGRRTGRSNAGSSEGTVIIPYLYLDQLDPHNLSKCHLRYNLTRDPLLSTGMTITRAGERGDIPLDHTFGETATVGQEHAVVALDNHGCFIQNCHSNGMYLLQGSELIQVEEASIEEGTIIYLGKQPIRFSYPKIQQATRASLMNKLLVLIRMIAGSLVGFAGRRRRSPSGQSSQQNDW